MAPLMVVTCFLLLTKCIVASSIALPIDSENHISVQCVTKIATNSFPCNTTVSLVGEEEDINYFIKKLSPSYCNALLTRTYVRYNTRIRSDGYIIIIDNMSELINGMYNITRGTFWNPSRHILIHHHHSISNKTMWKIFEIALKFKMYNMVFVGKVDEDFAVYTYYPFDNMNCGRKFDYIKKISNCSSLDESINFFPNKHPNGLRNCTIYVLLVEDIPNVILNPPKKKKIGSFATGTEQFVIDIVSEVEGLNILNVQPKSMEYGFVLSNLTVTGILGQLQMGEVDFVAGGFILTNNRAEVFDFLLSNQQAKYILSTHAFRESKWKAVYKEFDLTVWITIVLCSAIYIVIMSVYKYFHRRNKTKFDWIENAIMFTGYIFVNANQKLGKDYSSRHLLFLWMLFTFFISNFYMSKLYSLVMMNVRLREDINASSVGSDKTRVPCISNVTRSYFQNAYNWTLPTSSLAGPECETSANVLKVVAREHVYYTVELDYVHELRRCSFLDEEGLSKISSWPDHTFSVYISIYYSKGFPLKEKFNSISSRIFETGLIAKQLTNILNDASLHCSAKKQTFRIIRVKDLRAAFFILFAGAAISTITFAIEIFLERKSTAFSNKSINKMTHPTTVLHEEKWPFLH